MRLSESTWARMPKHLQELFEQLPNPGREEVVSGFPKTKSNGGGTAAGDSGSAARYFYAAKADAEDRLGSKHPTVKPLDLLQWLCRLITPPRGHILDCFAGTGTTAEAALREGFRCTLIEREDEYLKDIDRRMLKPEGDPLPLFTVLTAEAAE